MPLHSCSRRPTTPKPTFSSRIVLSPIHWPSRSACVAMPSIKTCSCTPSAERPEKRPSSFFGWPWPRRPSSRCRSVALKEGLRAEENCRAAATSPLGHYYRELRHSEKPSALIIHRPSASTPYPYWRTLLQCSWDRPRIGIVIDVPLRCCCLNAAVLSKYHGE